MAKPPATPPHSDLDGVREDEHRIDVPENSRPDPGARLEHARQEDHGRPEGNEA